MKEKIVRIIAQAKYTSMRGYGWIGIITTFITLSLVAEDKLKNYLSFPFNRWYGIVIILVLITLLIGYLDIKLGFLKEELRMSSDRTPILRNIYNQLKK